MEEKDLYRRERDVVKAIKQGYIADEEIAKLLKISPHTVNSCIQRLYNLFDIEGKQKRGKLVREVMK